MAKLYTYKYVSIVEAADICGYAPDTMRLLVQLELGPAWEPRRSYRRILTVSAEYFAKYYADPNSVLLEKGISPLFALHDDGRWWPLISLENAVMKGKARYFEGLPCEAGHSTKRYTKTRKCIDCCQVANGKPSAKQIRLAKNSSTSPG